MGVVMSNYILVKRGTGYVRVKKNHQMVRNRKRQEAQTGGGFGIALLTLIAFAWLAYAAFEAQQPASYDNGMIEQLNRISENAVMPKTKLQQQAAALQDLYQISDDEISKPVRLW